MVMKAPFFLNIRLISVVRLFSCDCKQISRIANAMAVKYCIRGKVVMHETIKMYRRNCICIFLAVSLFISTLTAGAEQAASSTAREKLKTRVTFSCVEKPIEAVLMELADKANIDIIKSPKVTGNVTVKVTDVPLEEALTNILAIYDCTYIATDNMIRVFPLPPQSEHKEKQVTRIYKITYADASEVYEALKKFVSGKAEIGFSKGTSHIMVTDTEDKIKPIDKFIEQIDRITSQVLVEVRIYEVITNEGFELSPDWRVGRNAPFTADTIIFPDEIQTLEIGPESRTFSENVLNEYYDATWGIDNVHKFDTQLQENWITESGRKDIERTWKDPKVIPTNIRRKPFVGGSFDRITGGTLSFSVLNDAVDIDIALSILHTQVEARLLANPRILVLDNETANFEIVREIPYREVKQVGREDPITFTAFKKVGVDLKVTPHIARDGVLRLHIVPKFSVLVSQDMLGVSGQFGVLGVPTIDARRLETKAMIKDGQTIVIGGLRQRETSKDITKVPVLGDLPFVGGLFVSETESVMISELLVFITTRIITDPTLSKSEQKLLDSMVFTSPVIGKTRIEKGEFEIPGIENGGFGNTRVDKPDITDSLELLLKKLGPSRN